MLITEELMKMERRPDEPNADGYIRAVYFEKKYDVGRSPYAYIAMRGTDGKWYITGPQARHAQGRTWDELLDFVEVDAKNDAIATLRLAGKWKFMVPE